MRADQKIQGFPACGWLGGVMVVLFGVIGLARAEEPAGPTAAEYQARRQRLVEQVRAAEGNSAPVWIVIVGKGEPADDAKFHQDNDFHYLTGVDVPFAAAILRPGTPEETLYLPPGSKERERFEGPMLAPGPEAARQTGFARVASTAEFLADLFRGLADPGAGPRSGSVVYLIDPEPTESSASRNSWLTRLVRSGAPGARVKELAPRVHELRKTKSVAEVDLLRRAIAATGAAQAAVAQVLAPGRSEAEMEGLILDAYLRHGAHRPGFPSIVGSGLNSTVLHYDRNDRAMKPGDLVVVDIGAEVAGYTADITRTYPVGGQFTPRQREVYQLVLDAQAGAARECQPGKSTIGSLNRWVRAFFRDSPLRARDEDGTEQTMDHFFAHGLGHQLGLEVHDVGDNARPLESGQVFTIEPGLYIPAEGFGVRIEDDYLVTPTGVEKLSEAIPSAANAVERHPGAEPVKTSGLP